MRCTSLSLAVAAALVGNLAAQDFIGFSYNGQVSATSRGSLGNNPGEVMTRIDGGDYAGWGTDTPGTRTITSLFFVAQDQLAPVLPTTGNTFDIKIYPEDVANPGFPDINAGVVFATGVTGPTIAAGGVPGIAAVAKIVTPSAPVSVPIQGGGDVFVSWVLPAVTATSNLSIQVTLGYQPSTAFTVYDLPGPTQPPASTAPGTPTPITTANTHGVSLVGTTLSLNGRRNHLFDVAHNGTGGCVLGITNQSTFAGSNNPPPTGFGPAPGTADFMSGVSPDGNAFNVGRGDDIAFDFFKTGMPAGSLVFFGITITTPFLAFEPPLPALGLSGTGVLCVDPGDPTFLLNAVFPTTLADEAFWVTSFPAGVRSLLPGYVMNQQAFFMDASFNFAASPCGASHF